MARMSFLAVAIDRPCKFLCLVPSYHLIQEERTNNSTWLGLNPGPLAPQAAAPTTGPWLLALLAVIRIEIQQSKSKNGVSPFSKASSGDSSSFSMISKSSSSSTTPLALTSPAAFSSESSAFLTDSWLSFRGSASTDGGLAGSEDGKINIQALGSIGSKMSCKNRKYQRTVSIWNTCINVAAGFHQGCRELKFAPDIVVSNDLRVGRLVSVVPAVLIA